MLFTIWTESKLQINFGWYTASPEEEALRDTSKQAAVERLGIAILDEYPSLFPAFSISEWGHEPRRSSAY
jgi:hypothetical protein